MNRWANSNTLIVSATRCIVKIVLKLYQNAGNMIELKIKTWKFKIIELLSVSLFLKNTIAATISGSDFCHH